MSLGRKLALVAGATVLAAGVAMAQPAKKAKPEGPKAAAPAAQRAGSGEQVVTGPIAVYWVSAATQSGFGMPGVGGAGGGGRPSPMEMMRMMQGGGGPQHNLTLQLGSSESPKGDAPHAEHLPPQGLGVGPSLPLLTPEVQKVEAREPEEERPEIPREYQKPKGRMLIFWGCGEHARPGQPLVVDFSQMTPEKISAGQLPANFAAMMKGFNTTAERGRPGVNRNTTYGDWPNARSTARVPGTGSLVGDHVISGDYSPEIRFALNANQDFLGPLNLTTNAKLPSGAVQLGWGAVQGAEGYAASMIGGSGQDTVVMWVSSETQAAAFALPEYLSPGDLSRLVASKALMGPEATSCAVPQEAVAAVKGGLVQMIAYGHDANFVYPPRPSDPKVAWNRQWEVKVRYRSATGGILGQAMPQMDGGGRGRGYPTGDQAQGQPPPQSPQDAAAARRRAILNGLGGGLGGLIPH
jgi:hypothetical protein